MIPTAPAPRRSPVPLLFVALACSLPALIAVQLFLVGLGVFADAAAWALHRALGGALVVPAAGALILAACASYGGCSATIFGSGMLGRTSAAS